MSFTTSVKSEVAANELSTCCAKAQCSALIKMCSSLNINANGMYLTIQSESAPTAKKILKLLKIASQGYLVILFLGYQKSSILKVDLYHFSDLEAKILFACLL